MYVRFLVSLIAILLASCASPMPGHDPKMAWVDLYTKPSHSLTAERLDGETLRDGRFFQVTPGKHVLRVRFKYEVSSGGGGGGGAGGGGMGMAREMTCLVDLVYDNFAAGRRYRLEVRPQLHKALALLTDEDRDLVARTNFQGPVRCQIS